MLPSSTPAVPTAATDNPHSPSEHIAFLFESDAEHRAILTPYLREGLTKNERVLYIYDASTPDTILGYLRDAGIDPQPYLESGQLLLSDPDGIYLHRGQFHPKRMMDLLHRNTRDAHAQGYSGLRIAAEMSWSLYNAPGTEFLLQYEASVNRVFPDGLVALCQYDARRFPPETLHAIMDIHPILIVGGKRIHNPDGIAKDVYGSRPSSRQSVRARLRALRETPETGDSDTIPDSAHLAFRTFADTTSDCFIILDRSGTHIYANQSALTYVGKTTEEVVGHTLDEVLGHLPDFRRIWATRLEEVIRDGHEILSRDDFTIHGRLVHSESKVTPIRDATGHVQGVGILYRDITDRRRDAESLERHRMLLRQILDTLPQAIFWKDRSGRFLGCNMAFARYAGRSDPADVVGVTDDMLPWPAEDTAAYRLDDAEVLRTGIPKVGILEPLRPADGKRLLIKTSKFPLADRKGIPFAVMGMFEDITETQRLQQALQESEARFRMALTHSEMILFHQDHELRYTWISVNKLGFTPDEALGKTDADLFPPEDAHTLTDCKRRVLETGTPHRGEVCVSIHGSRRWYDLTVEPVRDADHAVCGISCTALDITENKERTLLLQQTDKFRALATLSAGLAHEINNPLGAILGDLQNLDIVWPSLAPILQAHAADNPDATLGTMPLAQLLQEIPDMLQAMQASGQRIASLIHRVRDYCTPNHTVQHVPVSVNMVVERALSLLRKYIADACGSFNMILPDDVPPIHGNPDTLEQLVVNLLMNACQAVQANRGSITIATERTGDTILLRVSDTGCGMPPEVREHLFDPFFSTRQANGGTGLGLPIVLAVVREHNASIQVESAPGIGTAFLVQFPLTPDNPKDSHERNSHP